ncbi:MAG: efflux RND transporter periplasmic adaptor subunit [Vicinamibacterales bacterium]|nr:efflux RND transporter periplasmic adaptor subunit [Vicinamibacterales bacterium]
MQATWFRIRGTVAAGAAVLGVALTVAACGGGAAPAGPGGPPGGFPAMGVEVLTLEPRSIEQTTEYIGTVKSRRSTTIQPQAEGFITRIAVRSGDRVRAGAVLMEVDSASQQATVANLQSLRAAREADVAFARQQDQRMRTLLEAGAVSARELEQATTALQTSEAQLQAVDAQIRQQQVELAYHRVTAPTAGVVGDIPVRVGDRVTRATQLTTVDDNEGLEVYLNVPVALAPDLRVGLPVRLMTDGGEVLATEALTFVAPSVDETTQTVLAKAAIATNTPGFRTSQYVRARIVWRDAPGLTVPLVSVTRINGRYFVFVAETAEGQTIARQRPVDLGDVVGNDYVVRSGLSAGDRLIISGVQKIGDGMPVSPQPAAAAPAAGPQR